MPIAAGGDKDGEFRKNEANADADSDSDAVCEAVTVGGTPATRNSSTYDGSSGGSESALHFHQELVRLVPGRVVPDPG